MIRLIFLLAYLFVFVGAQLPSTKDWRGLVPLKSTRADVERVLGTSDVNTNSERMTYYLPNVVVFINFTANPKCQRTLPYESWDVAPGTVTAISIKLRRSVLVSEAGVDLTKFKKIKGDHDVVDHFYYSNIEDGFSIEVGQNYVGGYLYEPGSAQKHLLCPVNK
jgi:hypothetical protein